ncbi:tetratricopeptide repeat protein [Geopsychrobacter electrodiphilus]|uniref:tetratricopeptide repeat protein n=1 Tax=Geopsychrobacter electrodiphilus TaxID=225196 RepID=UPI000476B69D|nr:tetratricopeptide repeat protein [Geopsychrobacter electrodiphilus]
MAKKQQSGAAGSISPMKTSRRTPLWLAFALPVVAILIFFVLLEGGLAVFGVKPASQTEDPFVGFSSTSPLFVSATGADGQPILITAPNKKDYFNRQSFPQQKAPNTYRIFSLGGSTTYGRPYDDATSFSGWLRELLPEVDQSKNWEVINAGGISYASYRVAQLMEELVRYQPDLFIIYTGHNEFLEERTYHKIKSLPPLIRSSVSLLTHTRTWTAMNSALKTLHLVPDHNKTNRYKLSAEVNTILDQSAGPERYTRDDALQENIVKHYRISLKRMVSLARSVGAKVILVKPASNLKDCSPFKSQHTPGLSATALQQSERFEAMSQPFYWQKNFGMALNFLNQAAKLDPRSADLQYRRGQTLLGLGLYKEAKTALISARDEDVCPLRALSSIVQTVTAVANEQQVPLVDFPGLLEQRMRKKQGYAILGKEYFLDHVHPTIEGHKILASGLLQTMSDQGLIRLDPTREEQALAKATATIEGGLNPTEKGFALANLARVLLWAGKNDDAARLAKQAIETAGSSQKVVTNAASTLATSYVRFGKPQMAVKQLYAVLKNNPGSVELRLKLGEILSGARVHNYTEAAANLLLVIQQMPYYDWAQGLFGIVMFERGRPRIAYSSLKEALRLNPNNANAKLRLEKINDIPESRSYDPTPPQIKLNRYPSTAPQRVVQGRVDAQGNFVSDGIEAEFYENGRLKRFVDFDHGQPTGAELTWDDQGKPTFNQPHQ